MMGRVDEAEWAELVRTAPGRPVEQVEERLRALVPRHGRDPQAELSLSLTARVLVDPRWLRHHPLAACSLAWRHRRVRSPLRTLLWLRRPRFAG